MNASGNQSSARDALPALTGIRFFAAFYVVLFHALPWLDAHFRLSEPVRIFLGNGYLAVCLFYLLSGFILAYTYGGKSSRRDLWAKGWRAKFWEARFARVYPVYFLSLLMALPFAWHELTASTMASVLLMVQAWNPLRPQAIGAWNYPAWSLSVEAFFYLCFPFVQSRLVGISRRSLLMVGGVALLVAVVGHTPTQGLGTWASASFAGRWISLPILRFPEFLAGIVMGNIFLVDRGSRRHAGAHGPAVAAWAALASLLCLSIFAGAWVSLVALPFGLMIYSLAGSRDFLSAFLSHPLMLLLGGASYSIYLLQLPLRDWVRVGTPRISLRLVPLSAPLTPLILIGFSIFIFRCWEEPMRHSIRRWLAPVFS